MDTTSHGKMYSIRTEPEGSEDLVVALSQGWEPFAILPSVGLNEFGQEVEFVMIYLRFRNY